MENGDPYASFAKPVQEGPTLKQRSTEASIASSEQSARASAQATALARAKFIRENGIAPEDVKPMPATPGDTSLTGEEYLATVDPALARQARMYIDGRRPFPTGAAMRNQRTQLAIDIAMQADPTLDAANAATRVATRKDFTSGMSARNLTALNTAIGHLASLKKTAEALNNTFSPKINEPLNTFQSEWLGDKRVNNFNTVRDAFATELAKVFKGTGAPSLAEIEDWKKRANAAQSPEQLMGFVHEAADLLQSRINAVGDTYNRGLGKSADPVTLLTPKSQKLFNELAATTATADGDKNVGVFEAPPEGAQVSGEPVKGYRLSAEQEAALDAYARSDKFTPEGFADMSAAAVKAQTGADIGEAGRAAAMENGSGIHEYYKKNPDASTVGFDYSTVDKSATENAGLGASVAQGLRNLPESAYNLVTGAAAPATDLARSLVAGKREGLYEAIPNAVADAFGAKTGTLDAMGAGLADKYGSLAGLKRNMILDPLALPADASMAASLGGTTLARLPSAVGRFGEGLAAVGRAVDPLSGTLSLATEGLPALARRYSLPAGVKRATKDVAAEAAAFPSGVGGATLREGYSAGQSAGLAGAPTPRSEAFTGNMRDGAGRAGDAVSLARDAVANLREAASRRYNAAMANFGRTPVPLAPDNLRATMLANKPKNYDTMLDAPHRPADHVAWQQMNDTVEHYLAKAAQDPTLLEPLAVDQFKQDLYTIGSKIGGAADRDAARIAGGAYRSVRKMLTDHDPLYAEYMKDYADAAQEAASLESGFSLASPRGKPVNVDAASRKLQSIMRNNANTNYGQRAAQGERLADLDPTGTIMPTLAGQSASSWAPRGLRGNVEGAGLLAEGLRNGVAGLLSPKLWAALAPTSPRVMGELAYGAGRGVGAAKRVGANLAPAVKSTTEALGDLYNKYPTLALSISRADQYSDETNRRTQEDELFRRYGFSNEMPSPGE